MTHFIQGHILTVYPLSNPNRDDTGRPKTATFGGAPRLRISSQALKRSARIAEPFRTSLEGKLGERTRRLGDVLDEALASTDCAPESRNKIVQAIVTVFGKLDADIQKKSKRTHTRQLAFISPEEKAKAIQLALAYANGEKLPPEKELKQLILQTADGAADVAMFGRMLADAPQFNREAAVQVSHAFTTHRALVEDDYYTAVDDNNSDAEDAGAGFVGEAGFGSGVFYLYFCIDKNLLVSNLGGDAELANVAIEAFIRSITQATPSGKRASFANHTRANYVLIEKGTQQPRSLAEAFMKPVRGDDLVTTSVSALKDLRERLERAYGPGADEHIEMNVNDNTSATLDELASKAAA